MGLTQLAWHAFRGDIPEGMSVLHACDNPACCNPAHLFIGTQADNMADMRAKGRAVGNVKLSVSEVLALRRLTGYGYYTTRDLADLFGVSTTTVLNIHNRKTWKSIPEEDTL